MVYDKSIIDTKNILLYGCVSGNEERWGPRIPPSFSIPSDISNITYFSIPKKITSIARFF